MEQIIKLDSNRNIVLKNDNDEVFIDTKKSEELHQKLGQLNDKKIAVMLQMIDDHGEKLSDIFKTAVNRVASQKNVEHGSFNATTARIGDEIYYHFFSEQEIKLPKKLTLSIPTVAQDAIVGRDKDLEELRSLLLSKKQALILNSLGGIGKTTLAQFYVHKYWEEYQHIVWISQNSIGSFLLDFISAEGLKDNLNIGDENNKPEDIFNKIISKLNSIQDQPNLLILDNVDESIEKFKSKLPLSPRWHILLTSREELNGFPHRYLDFLDDEGAFQLFKKHYKLNELTNDQIKELISILDFHTLTIELLAKTATHQHYYFEKLKDDLSHDFNADVKITRLESSERIEKITSFLYSIFSLSKLSEDEIWLLQQMVCIPSDYHSYQLLFDLIQPEENNKGDIFALTLDNLLKKGWLLKNIETHGYKLHSVVAEVVKRKQLPKFAALESLLERITELLFIDHTKDNPADKFKWIPFGKRLLKIVEEQDNKTYEQENYVVKLQNELAIVLMEFGEYKEAKSLFQKAVKATEKYFGMEHPKTAIYYSNLAKVNKDLGDYREAKSLLQKAVKATEKYFGMENPVTAASYSNLAMVLQYLGEFEEAKSLLQKAINSDEKNFGVEHPNTAISYSNLAGVLMELGDYKEAKSLLQKAIKSDEKNFGLEHPTTATSYSNLAGILMELGEYKEAKSLLQNAIKSDEKNLGLEHPTTATKYSNLVGVLMELGEYKEAKSLLQKVIKSDEKNFGLEHPIRTIHYSNLALISKELGEFEEAKSLLQEVVKSDEKNFGLEHPNTATSYSNLALVLQSLGEFEEAKSLLQKAIKSDEKNFGVEHPNTAIYYANLATVLNELGEYDRALKLEGRALSIFKDKLPAGHPNTKTASKIYNKLKHEIE